MLNIAPLLCWSSGSYETSVPCYHVYLMVHTPSTTISPPTCLDKNHIAAAAGTGELGYDGLNGTRKIGPSYAKSVVYI